MRRPTNLAMTGPRHPTEHPRRARPASGCERRSEKRRARPGLWESPRWIRAD